MMKNKTLRVLYFMISAVFLSIWLILIFGMSAQSGEKSAELSYKLTDFLYKLPFIKMIFRFNILHTLIRKLAHFTEYGILGLLVINFINACGFRINKLIMVCTSVFCCLYAGLDEYHQSFVDGRGPSIRDVMIDTSGAVFFLFVYVAVKGIIKRKSVVKS